MADKDKYLGWSDNMVDDWNSHLFLKKKNKHPLGNKIKLQYLGKTKVSGRPLNIQLPKSPITYVRQCENCGQVFVPYIRKQRFHSDNCRVKYYKKNERRENKIKILENYNFQCSNGLDCPLRGSSRGLKIFWKKDSRPYCYKCFYEELSKFLKTR